MQNHTMISDHDYREAVVFFLDLDEPTPITPSRKKLARKNDELEQRLQRLEAYMSEFGLVAA